MLDGRDVVDTLRKRPGKLLESRVAIEFQRIEGCVVFADLHQAGLDLRFGLDLELADLGTQADYAARELEQIRLQRAQLAFDARPCNRHFAGLVDQAIDDVGAHPQHRMGAGLDFGSRSASGRVGRLRRRKGCDNVLLGARRRRERGNGLRMRRESRHGRSRLLRFDGIRQRDVRPALAQRIEHVCDPIEVRVERLEQFLRPGDRRFAGRQSRLHLMRELAETHRAGHPRAALERVQRAPQLSRVGEIAGRAPPSAHLFARLRIELGSFLEEDRQHLLVDVVANVGERIVQRFSMRFERRDVRQRGNR